MDPADMILSNVLKFHSSPAPGKSSIKPLALLSLGIWGILYLLLYPVSLVVVFLYYLAHWNLLNLVLCFPIPLLVAALFNAFLTITAWILWKAFAHLDVLPGLDIGREFGRFERDPGGWLFSRYLVSKKTTLDLKSASPHILIVGGSQSGKSTTIRTLLGTLTKKRTLWNSIGPFFSPAIILLAIVALVLLVFWLYFGRWLLMPLVLVLAFAHWPATYMVDILNAWWVLGGIVIVAVWAWYVRSRVKTGAEEGRGHVVIDFHNEYSYLANNGFFVVDALEYAPLAPIYQGEPSENRVSDVVDSFLTAFTDVGDVQLAILKKALDQGMGRNGTLSDALITIQQAMSAAKSYYEKDRYAGLHLRLAKIAGYGTGQKNIHELTGDKRNVVFNFSRIRDKNAADFYADLILRRYLAVLMEMRLPTTIVIDEAHRLNNPKLRDRGFTTTTIKIAREAGKFGGRLIIASQNLVDFPDGFSANFGNILVFRIPSASDLQQLEKMTGISGGLLHNVMNGLIKGEALLIAPKDHYALVRVDALKMAPTGPEKSEVQPSAAIAPQPAGTLIQAPKLSPRIPRSEMILETLKKEGAMTATELSRKSGYPKPAVWRRLQSLTKAGKVIRYEELETREGMEVFYEVNNPNRNESSFHRILVSKVERELANYGSVKVLGGWNNPDLVFNGKTAVEVETGTKPELLGFADQVRKRFGQGYASVIIVVINQRQKVRYEKALAGARNVAVVKLTEPAKTVQTENIS